MFKPKKILVGLPAFNESLSIVPLVNKFAMVSEQLDEYELLLLLSDDASSDDTVDRFRTACNSQSLSYAVMASESNCGLGMGVRNILSEFLRLSSIDSSYQFVVIMDADNTHQPDQLAQMLEKAEGGADIVVASRYTVGATIHGLSKFRKVASEIAGWYLHQFYRSAGTRDFTCGFRIYNKKIIEEVSIQTNGYFVRSFGFDCMPEVLIRGLSLGAKISEVPLTLRYDEKLSTSKMKFISNSLKVLALPFRLRGI